MKIIMVNLTTEESTFMCECDRISGKFILHSLSTVYGDPNTRFYLVPLDYVINL